MFFQLYSRPYKGRIRNQNMPDTPESCLSMWKHTMHILVELLSSINIRILVLDQVSVPYNGRPFSRHCNENIHHQLVQEWSIHDANNFVILHRWLQIRNFYKT